MTIWNKTGSVPQKTFADLPRDKEGIIFYGCGGDIMDWVNGVTKEMLAQGSESTALSSHPAHRGTPLN